MNEQLPTSRYWQAPSMKRRVFGTWSDFFAYLDEYQSATSQVGALGAARLGGGRR